MTHQLPALGYEYNALEPFIDEQTMTIHHTKHHQTYVDKLNAALDKHPEFKENRHDQAVFNMLIQGSSVETGLELFLDATRIRS